MASFPSNIVLIGFMGSGKTTVSRLLGDTLERKVVDIDGEIAQRAGFSSVSKIIDEKGEPYFRDLESNLAREVSGYKDVIISTGGGIISRPYNMESFKSAHACIVFLKCSFESAHANVSSATGVTADRPLFRDVQKAKELFAARQPIYTQWADITVSVDSLSPIQVRDQILQQLTLFRPQ